MLSNLIHRDFLNITKDLVLNNSNQLINLKFKQIIFENKNNITYQISSLITLKNTIENEWNDNYYPSYIELLLYILNTSDDIIQSIQLFKDNTFIKEEDWFIIINLLAEKNIDSLDEDSLHKFKMDFIDILNLKTFDGQLLFTKTTFIESVINYKKFFLLEHSMDNIQYISLDRKVNLYVNILHLLNKYPSLLMKTHDFISSLLIQEENCFTVEHIKKILTMWNIQPYNFNSSLKKSLFSAKDHDGKFIIIDILTKYYSNIENHYSKFKSSPVLKYTEYFISHDLNTYYNEEEKNIILKEISSVCGVSLLLKHINPDNISLFFNKNENDISIFEQSLFTSNGKELVIALLYIYQLPVSPQDIHHIQKFFRQIDENSHFKQYILPELHKPLKHNDVYQDYDKTISFYRKEIIDLKKEKKEYGESEEFILKEKSLIENRDEHINNSNVLMTLTQFLENRITEFKKNDKYESYSSLQQLNHCDELITSNNFEDYWLYTKEDFESFEKDVIDFSSEEDPARKWVDKLRLSSGLRKIATNKSLMQNIDKLRAMFPNFNDFINYIEDNLYLHSIGNNLLKINPSLLISKPGTGKTFFLSKLAELAGTHADMINMESITGGFILTGLDSRYTTGSPGLFFKNMLNSPYVNNLMILDEIDKCSTSKENGGVEDVLLPLLEEHSSKYFKDEFLRLPIDMSHVNWIATANNLKNVSDPLLSRFKKFEIPSPNFNERKILAQNIYSTLLTKNSWGIGFKKILNDTVLDIICFDPGSTRQLRQNIESAIAKCARRNSNKLREIQIADLDIHSQQIINEWDEKKYE